MPKTLGRILLWATLALFGFVAWCAARAWTYPVDALATRAPERTAMMRQREAEARRLGKTLQIDQRWVGYGRISPLLSRSVLVAEDDAFFSHGGLDWREIQASAKTNLEKRRIARGGSTITQQLARNLFLGDRRAPDRKLTEVFLAFRLERALPKRRILELYLNLIEWGDGIFGAEAAARRHFGVSAAGLSPRQAVLLAAVIINPRRYSAREPARRIEKRVRLIASRLRRRGLVSEAQHRQMTGAREPIAEQPGILDWFFGRGGSAPRPSDSPRDSAASSPPDTSVSSEGPPDPGDVPAPPPDSSAIGAG